MRKKIPTPVETDLLIQSRRICAICYGIYGDTSVKKGQIAHLDKDNENDTLDNLVWLCFDHHDQYDSTTRQSKNFTYGEVKSYRSRLYQFTKAQWENVELEKKSIVKNEPSYGGQNFLAGVQLKEIRNEIALTTSEFIELVGLDSEKQYLQMENNEIECNEIVIKKIASATGALPEWIKHRCVSKYEIEPITIFNNDTEAAIKAADSIIECSTGLVYLTIAASTPKSDLPIVWNVKNLWARMRDKYLHVGVCVPVGKFKYRVFDTNFNFVFDDEYRMDGYTRPLYLFLKRIWDSYSFNARGIIISNWKDEEDLYEGRVHPEKIISKHYYIHHFDWLEAVLDIECKRSGRTRYGRYGNWIKVTQTAFKKAAK